MQRAEFERREARVRQLESAPLNRALVLIAIILTALLIPTMLQSQEAARPALTAPQSITVSGRGDVVATPDRATITFRVETRAESASTASRDNARLQESVLGALRGAGIESADLSTSGYSLHPEQSWDPETRTSRVIGYVASNSVQVRVRQIEQVGDLIDRAIAAGSNGVGNLQFSSSRSAELRREALAAAVASACSDAEVMAAAAGGSVGRLLEMTSGQSIQPPQPMMMMDRSGVAMAESSITPIEPGELTIWAFVTARWEFVGAGAGSGCAR